VLLVANIRFYTSRIRDRLCGNSNVPPKTMTKKCIRCGICCKTEVCKIGRIFYGTIVPPCPGLLFQHGIHWCQLVKCASDECRVALEQYMTIGFGCEW